MSNLRSTVTSLFILLALVAEGSAEPAPSPPTSAITPPTTQGAPTRTVTPDEIVSTLLGTNVSLYAASLGIRQAGEATREEEGRFPYVFQADAGYTHSENPQVANGTNVVTESDGIVVGSQLSRTFPTGTTATLRAEGQRVDTLRPTTTTTINNSNANGIGYQASLRATVSQPLLSGYGTEVNESGLRAARINETRLQKAHQRTRSEMVRDALSAYWELWYAARAIEIQRGALNLAILQQQDADKRVLSGALSPADALKFQSTVASLTESWLTAQSTEMSQAVELGRIVGTPDQALDWRAAPAEPESLGQLARGDTLKNMLAESPVLADLKEALRLAVERRKTAGDAYRSRLDLSTWAEVTGAGERPGPALRQVGNLEALSVYGGIVYQTSLGQGRIDAARAQADYDVQIAQANLTAQTKQLQSTAARLLVQAEQARISAEASQATLDIARKQAENERQRFALGASTPLDVQVAEEALRQAQIRVVRAKVDRIKTELALSHSTGELWTRYVAPRGGN